MPTASAPPAQITSFLARGSQPGDDAAEAIVQLLERLADWPERFLFFGHGRELAPATARTEQGRAARGLDVKRELELLVPRAAPGEKCKKMPKVSHMFS
ncbi:MAG: hypothetical protein ABIU29_08475 [Chthoniobacterales bacterium]